MAGENAERAGPLRPLPHPILAAFAPKFIVSQKLCQPDWGKTWEIFFASPPRTFQKREHVSGMNSHASPHRGQGRPGRRQCRRPGRLRGRRCPRHRRVRGPQCDSCTSRNPGFFAPPPVSFLHKQELRLLCTHPPCPSCASRNPVRLSPCGRGWPAVQAGRVRGSPCPSCASSSPGFFAPTPSVIPAQAAVQYASPHRGRGRRCPRHRRVRGPQCPSCASRNPAGVIPAKAGTQAPLGMPLGVIPAQAGIQQVSFLRKQQSSTPLPTAGEAGGAQGTAG